MGYVKICHLCGNLMNLERPHIAISAHKTGFYKLDGQVSYICEHCFNDNLYSRLEEVEEDYIHTDE